MNDRTETMPIHSMQGGIDELRAVASGLQRVNGALECQIERLTKERDEAREWKANTERVLADGHAVHVNMLRGTIATPTKAQLLHVLGNQGSTAAKEGSEKCQFCGGLYGAHYKSCSLLRGKSEDQLDRAMSIHIVQSAKLAKQTPGGGDLHVTDYEIALTAERDDLRRQLEEAKVKADWYVEHSTKARTELASALATVEEAKQWRNEAEGELIKCGATIGELCATVEQLRKNLQLYGELEDGHSALCPSLSAALHSYLEPRLEAAFKAGIKSLTVYAAITDDETHSIWLASRIKRDMDALRDEGTDGRQG